MAASFICTFPTTNLFTITLHATFAFTTYSCATSACNLCSKLVGLACVNNISASIIVDFCILHKNNHVGCISTHCHILGNTLLLDSTNFAFFLQ